MISRFLTCLAVCLAAVFVLHREAGRGTLRPVEAGYFAWLSANARLPAIAPNVTFLRLDRNPAGGGEPIFGEWPPAALDYALLLENLAPMAPAVAAVEPVLHLDPADPIAAPILAERARAIPSLVLGITLANAPADAPAPEAQVPSPLLPRIPADNVRGNHENLPAFTHVLQMAAEPLMMNGNASTGFTEIDLGLAPTREADGTIRVPLLARSGDRILPSLGLRTLMAMHGVAPEEVRAHLGSHLALGSALRLPIDSRGRLPIPPQARAAVIRTPADNLFLDPDSDAKLTSEDEAAALESVRGGVVVLGLDSDSDRRFRLGGDGDDERISAAEATALTVAAAEAGQFFRSPGPVAQFALWGVLVLLGSLATAFRRRRSALLWLLVLAIAYAVTALLVFQTTLTWWPAAIPASILVISLVLVLLLPKPGPAGAAGTDSGAGAAPELH